MHYFFLNLGPFELVVVKILVKVLLFSNNIVEEDHTDEQIDKKESTNIDDENIIDQHDHLVFINRSILAVIAINISVD